MSYNNDSAAIICSGAITYWNEAKGYGFIRPDGGPPDLFLHVSQLLDRLPVGEGDRVTCQMFQDENGWKARSVRLERRAHE
jgi:CspA family cold shock protein